MTCMLGGGDSAGWLAAAGGEAAGSFQAGDPPNRVQSTLLHSIRAAHFDLLEPPASRVCLAAAFKGERARLRKPCLPHPLDRDAP